MHISLFVNVKEPNSNYYPFEKKTFVVNLAEATKKQENETTLR